MCQKSFYRRMIEEKNLENETINIEHNNFLHIVEVEALITYIEQASEQEKITIKNTFSKIDFMNGNLMHYLTFLADCYVKAHY